MSIELDFDMEKIDNSLLVKGRYCRTRLVPNKEGRDQYGRDGFIAQKVSKEDYAAGKRGPIIGNWKDWSRDDAPKQSKKDDHVVYVDKDNLDDIPF